MRNVRRTALSRRQVETFVLASTACDATRSPAMSIAVKSEKTFEEIVERLAALFGFKLRPGDRDYEVTIDAEPITEHLPAARKPADFSKNNK